MKVQVDCHMCDACGLKAESGLFAKADVCLNVQI